MATAQQIADEIERRELIASIQGAATPVLANPAGPTPPQGAESSGFIDDTLDVVQEFGSGMGRTIAKGLDVTTAPQQAILQGMGRMTGLMGDTDTIDISDSTQEVFSGGQMDPGTARDMVSGGGELLPEIAATAVPVGLSGALALKGAKALGKVKKGLTPIRAAKPRVTIKGGKLVQTKPKKGLTRRLAEGSAEAAMVDAVVDFALGEDMDVATGAKVGAMGVAGKEFLTNTPAGRSLMIKMMRKVGGGGLTEAAWQAQNPRNQVVMKEIFEAFKRRAK